MRTKCKTKKPYSRDGQPWSLERFDEGHVDNNGYFRVYMPDHPRAFIKGQILRSWVAYEAYHDVSLEKGDVIHHINGIRSDDSKENLKKVSRGTHNIIHKSSKVRRFCKKCGKTFYVKLSHFKIGRGKYCSRECTKKH